MANARECIKNFIEITDRRCGRISLALSSPDLNLTPLAAFLRKKVARGVRVKSGLGLGLPMWVLALGM